MISKPWAVLLCKFNDDVTEHHERYFYDDLFTKSGNGKQNMVDYFREMSHGKVDVGDSETFGWFTLDKSLGNYRDYCAEMANIYADNPNACRHALVDWAVEKASMVDFKKFYGTVVVYNVGDVGLFGGKTVDGRGVVVCDEYSIKPSLLGQEMGHGFGLAHSRSHLNPKTDEFDYCDAWDIMSTLAAFSSKLSIYDSIGTPPGYPTGSTLGLSVGPGLNAANMDSLGWLDKSRVRIMPYGEDTITLRPLHKINLDGWLALKIDKYYFEFRMDEGWDGGFPNPAVLIHYFEDNHSYNMALLDASVMKTNGTILSWKGHKFHVDFPQYIEVEVLGINTLEKKVVLRVKYAPSSVPITSKIDLTHKMKYLPDTIGPYEYEFSDQDISTIIRKLNRNPEWSLRPILKSLSDISVSEQYENENIRRSIYHEALEKIYKQVSEELLEMDITHGGVAPPSLRSNRQ